MQLILIKQQGIASLIELMKKGFDRGQRAL